MDSSHHLIGGRAEVASHQVGKRCFGPIGICLAEKRCDLIGIRLPAGVDLLDLVLVICLGRFDQIGRDQNVVFQQTREPVAGPFAAPVSGLRYSVAGMCLWGGVLLALTTGPGAMGVSVLIWV